MDGDKEWHRPPRHSTSDVRHACSIHEPGLLQVLSQDDVFARIEHHLDVPRVRRTRNVVVNGPIRGLVLGHEFPHKVFASRLVVAVGAGEIGEAGVVADVLDADFFFEQISLVEEEDEGGLDEERVVADVFKEVQGFDHSVGGGVFEQLLIVLGDGRHEDDRRDPLETMDPLLTLVTLATHVVHFEDGAVDQVPLGDDARGTHTGKQNVVLVRQIIGHLDRVNFVEIVLHGLDDLEFGPTVPYLLHARVGPQGLDGVPNGDVDGVVLVQPADHVELGLGDDGTDQVEDDGLFSQYLDRLKHIAAQ